MAFLVECTVSAYWVDILVEMQSRCSGLSVLADVAVRVY